MAEAVRQTDSERPPGNRPEMMDSKWQDGQDDCRTERRTLVTLIGYARVSTLDQEPALQLDALAAAGCTKVFDDRASGARADRPGLRQALDYVRDGDVLVVWKLDRLSRSLKDLLLILERITAAGAGFRSLTEAIDTTVPAGRMMMQMLGAFAEYEREMVKERTQAGLKAARAQGRHGGR